jgi:hypothetical protein
MVRVEARKHVLAASKRLALGCAVSERFGSDGGVQGAECELETSAV